MRSAAGLNSTTRAVLIDRDDAVERGVEHAGLARLALLNLVLHPLAREKLPDLRADGREHPQQIVVGPADAARAELEHAEHLVADRDREREGAVQSFGGGGLEPRHVVLLQHVRDPLRCGVSPHVTRQPFARARRSESRLMSLEPRKAGGALAPDLGAAQPSRLRIHRPPQADVPVEIGIDDIDDSSDGLFPAGGVREHACDGVFGVSASERGGAFRNRGAEQQSRGRDDREEQLQKQQVVGDIADRVRTEAMHGAPDRDRGGHDVGGGGAGGAEPNRGPDEERKDDVLERNSGRPRASLNGPREDTGAGHAPARPAAAPASPMRRRGASRHACQVSSAGTISRSPAASPSHQRPPQRAERRPRLHAAESTDS